MTGREALDAVIHAVGGTRREGQERMADAVAEALDGGGHPPVQAGTGTGRSIGYLVPAMEWVVKTDSRVIVSTAILVLQRQIIAFDMPKTAEVVRKMHGRAPEVALIRGWSNYICLRKAAGGYPEEGALLSHASSGYGTGVISEEVVRLCEWVMTTDTGDRDDLAPGVSEWAWQQVSVVKPECIRAKCLVRGSCFPALACEAAEEADIVVTNHSMLKVQSTGTPVPPESATFVVDEAHEFAGRITGQLTASISKGNVSSLVRLPRRESILAMESESARDEATEALDEFDEGRPEALPLSLTDGLSRTFGELQQVREGVNDLGDKEEAATTAKALARGRVKMPTNVMEQLLSDGVGGGTFVPWVAHNGKGRSSLRVASLDVSLALADTLFEGEVTILTSATLETGGSFRHIAGVVGFTCPNQGPWKGVDIGSSFDHPRQGIPYATASLPPPGRESIGKARLREIVELVEAVKGSTPDLFTLRRAAEMVAGYARERLDTPVPCQGDDQLSTPVRRFAGDGAASLFDTLSLWQGVDVPGRTCGPVPIDRIPFPRPDDPLTQARTEAVVDTGGNDFINVAATYVALLFAQGANHLLHHTGDHGIIVILDPRTVTAHYGSSLIAPLSLTWRTKNPYATRSVLQRLVAAPDPVRDYTGGSDLTVQTGAET